MGNLDELVSPDHDVANSALVRSQLKRVLDSSGFAKADRLCAFLSFVVQMSLRGEASVIKETLIGINVYGRLPDYDPKNDPTVRTEARRLRQKLEQYYSSSGAHDRVIITIPRGGYAPKFEIRHQSLPGLEIVAAKNVTTIVPAVPSRGRIATWACCFLLVAVAGVVAWRYIPMIYRGQNVHRLTPFTRLAGFETQPSLSPDGRRVAFVWGDGRDHFDIYLKNVDDAQRMTRLTETNAHSLNPQWSPDGKQIAFLRLYRDWTKRLFLVPANGGRERMITNVGARQPNWVEDASVLDPLVGPSWSPNGKHLAVSDHSSEEEPDSIHIVSVETGAKQQATFPAKSDLGDFYPAFSPDGKKIAFCRAFNQSLSSDLYIQNLERSEGRRLTFDRKPISGVAWASNDQLVFASPRDGDPSLWRISTRGGMPEPLAGTGQNASHPAISRDGSTLVYSHYFRNTQIWRVGLGRQRDRVSASRLIGSSTFNDSAQYSPDGQQIVFVSDRSGVLDLWIANADGSNPWVLVSGNGAGLGTPRWSPDGSQIAFDMVVNGRSVILTVNAKGGEPSIVVSRDEDAMMPSWSRDGQFLYFSVSRIGVSNIWKQRVNGGSAFRVTQNGGGEASESFDGKTLYHLKKKFGIWQVPVAGGPETLVPGLEKVDVSRYFAVSRHGIYYLATEDSPWRIEYYDFRTHASSMTAAMDHAPDYRTPSLSVSPDERWLLYSQVDQSGEDLMLLRNFRR